jgi:hypothetical protein
MISQAIKMFKIAQLQKGKIVKLSKADIVDFSVNLLELKKSLSDEKYKKALELYKEYSKERKKIDMDLEIYNSTIQDMMKQFNDLENS